MSDILLILNAGSSSLKFSVFRHGATPELMLRGELEGLLTSPRFKASDASGRVIEERQWQSGLMSGHQSAIEFLFEWGQSGELASHHLVAAGHRVVHGGSKLLQPVLVDDGVLAELESLVPLAPLHQPHNIAAIRAVSQHAPQFPQVACFDTSFHRTLPAVAQRFAIPRELAEAGVRRYGFHGLSCEYIASQLPQIDPRAASGRTIVAHLGNGASLTALRAGVSIATTMGLTPLDGLPMGTRCGAIDPGVLLYLMNQRGLNAQALEKLLYRESGLLGVSGLSSDMRTLLAHEATDSHVAEAIELFVYRVHQEIGSLAAALGGLDALIFTGGIGEHATPIRDRICRVASWLGLNYDATANDKGGPQISRPDSPVSAWVIPTNEELVIARHTQHLLTL